MKFKYAQVIVTYEIPIEADNFQDAYTQAITTPWKLDLAIDSEVKIYDEDGNVFDGDE